VHVSDGFTSNTDTIKYRLYVLKSVYVNCKVKMVEVVRDITGDVQDYSEGRHIEAYGSVTRVVIASSTSLPERVQHASPAKSWKTTARLQQGYVTMPPCF